MFVILLMIFDCHNLSAPFSASGIVVWWC